MVPTSDQNDDRLTTLNEVDFINFVFIFVENLRLQ